MEKALFLWITSYHAFAMGCKDLFLEAHLNRFDFFPAYKNTTDMQMIHDIYVDSHQSQWSNINKNYSIWFLDCHFLLEYFFSSEPFLARMK